VHFPVCTPACLPFYFFRAYIRVRAESPQLEESPNLLPLEKEADSFMTIYSYLVSSYVKLFPTALGASFAVVSVPFFTTGRALPSESTRGLLSVRLRSYPLRALLIRMGLPDAITPKLLFGGFSIENSLVADLSYSCCSALHRDPSEVRLSFFSAWPWARRARVEHEAPTSPRQDFRFSF